MAVARLAGAVELEEREDDPPAVKRVLGKLSPEQVRNAIESPWMRGPWGWVLDQVIAIEGVPARGMQKLWQVRPEIAGEVRACYAIARGAA